MHDHLLHFYWNLLQSKAGFQAGMQVFAPDRAQRGCESSAGTLKTCFCSCVASC